jgi:soluble lytic murein transglycosylase-like protein
MDALTAAAAVALLIGNPAPANLTPASAGPQNEASIPDTVTRWDPEIAEAARRFTLPEAWIRSVIAAESAGMPSAVSSKGAMGLMQLMPETYREMRAEYGLGDDPFEPRDNVMAGSAFLRSMYDRFGMPGFLAAYNAGPQAMQEALNGIRPLPDESRIFVAKVSGLLGLPGSNFGPGLQSATVGTPATLFFSPAPAQRNEVAGPSWRQLFAPLGSKTTGASDDR